MADAAKPDPKAAAPAPAPAPAADPAPAAPVATDMPPVPKDLSKGLGVYKSSSGAWINAHGEPLDADGNVIK